jgi:hypothetical protein
VTPHGEETPSNHEYAAILPDAREEHALLRIRTDVNATAAKTASW